MEGRNRVKRQIMESLMCGLQLQAEIGVCASKTEDCYVLLQIYPHRKVEHLVGQKLTNHNRHKRIKNRRPDALMQ